MSKLIVKAARREGIKVDRAWCFPDRFIDNAYYNKTEIQKGSMGVRCPTEQNEVKDSISRCELFTMAE